MGFCDPAGFNEEDFFRCDTIVLEQYPADRLLDFLAIILSHSRLYTGNDNQLFRAGGPIGNPYSHAVSGNNAGNGIQ